LVNSVSRLTRIPFGSATYWFESGHAEPRCYPAGVGVGDDVAVGVTVGVGVSVGVGDTVTVGVEVGVDVGVPVGVGDGVDVGVDVGVGDTVGVGDGVGVPLPVMLGPKTRPVGAVSVAFEPLIKVLGTGLPLAFSCFAENIEIVLSASLATARSPPLSKLMPCGSSMVSAALTVVVVSVTAGVGVPLAVISAALNPTTEPGAIPFGLINCSLLTHRSPFESKAKPHGPLMLGGVGAVGVLLDSITSGVNGTGPGEQAALVKLRSAALIRTMVVPPFWATNRFPEESKAAPNGPLKSVLENTHAGASPVPLPEVSCAAVYASIRLAPVSSM